MARLPQNYPLLLLKESRIILRLAVPVMAAQVGQNLMTFVDTIMVGHYSAQHLAAIAAGTMLFFPLQVFANGVLMALSPIVAQFYGSGQQPAIGAYVRQGLYLSQLLALPIFLIVRHLAPVLGWIGIEPKVVAIADGYIHAISWGLPAAFAFMALRLFNEGIAVMKPGMYFTLVALACNVVGNSILIYGRFGLPELGAVGAGWSTAIAWWVMLACMTVYVGINRHLKPFNLLERWDRPNARRLLELLKMGLPIGLSLILEVGMFAATTLLIGGLGTNVLAGHQVALNVAAMSFMVPLGLSIATTVRVGQLVGQGNVSDARFSGLVSLVISVAIMASASLVLICFPMAIAGFYTSDPQVKVIAVKLLTMAAIFQIFDGLQVVAIGALRGLKDTRMPMLFNLISYWMVGLPIGYFLGIIGPFGAQGLWAGFIAGLLISACLNNLRFFQLTKPQQKSAS